MSDDNFKNLKTKLVSMGFDVERIESLVTEFKVNNPDIIERLHKGSKEAEVFVESLITDAIKQKKQVKDQLPESLNGVLGDIDITEELKRRLATKKLSKDLDCECKSLTPEEIKAAVVTAHDIRTRKLDPKDIESPVEIHPRLIEAAVCAPTRSDTSSGDTWRSGYKKQLAESFKVIEEDLKISKKVIESLVKKKIIDDFQSDEAKMIMTDALQRERDKEVVFVPVSGMEPRDAAQRVINLKAEYDEVEPIDLSHVFDDVNPICELHIEKLQPIMNVKKAIDLEGLPDEIRFVIPTVDLPSQTEDIKFGMTRYVHLDSMPNELQGVIRSYLSLRRGSVSSSSDRFKKAIVELAKRAEATFDDDKKQDGEPRIPTSDELRNG